MQNFSLWIHHMPIFRFQEIPFTDVPPWLSLFELHFCLFHLRVPINSQVKDIK